MNPSLTAIAWRERDGRNIYYGRKRRYGGILIGLNFILLVIEILICIGEENAEKVCG